MVILIELLLSRKIWRNSKRCFFSFRCHNRGTFTSLCNTLVYFGIRVSHIVSEIWTGKCFSTKHKPERIKGKVIWKLFSEVPRNTLRHVKPLYYRTKVTRKRSLKVTLNNTESNIVIQSNAKTTTEWKIDKQLDTRWNFLSMKSRLLTFFQT